MQFPVPFSEVIILGSEYTQPFLHPDCVPKNVCVNQNGVENDIPIRDKGVG
jgi:hypothetical protein